MAGIPVSLFKPQHGLGDAPLRGIRRPFPGHEVGTEDGAVKCVSVLRMWWWYVVVMVDCGKSRVCFVEIASFSAGLGFVLVACFMDSGRLLVAPTDHIASCSLAASVVQEQLMAQRFRVPDSCSV